MAKMKKNDSNVPAADSTKTAEELTELDLVSNLPGEELGEELGDDPAPEPIRNPRELAMAGIVKDSIEVREQQYIDEGMEIPGGKVDTDGEELVLPEELKALQDTDDDPEIVDNVAVKSNTPVVQADPALIKVKINGEEKEVSLEELKTHYQKNENADMKLGEANQILNNARTIQQTTASTLPDDSTKSVVDKSAVNSAVHKLYDGDVDEAGEDLYQIISKQNVPAQDVSALVAQEVLRLSDHKDLQSSFKAFKQNEDFKLIVSDPNLMARVNTLTDELQQDAAFMATEPNYEDFFNEAGKRTLDWVNSFAPPPETSSTDTDIQTRRDRKLNKPAAINARTVRRGPKKVKPAATREDTIAGMATARGQNVYNK